jgi:hypothetical protein
MSGNGQGSFWRPGSGLRSRYSRLQPAERFRAVIEAKARGDRDERETLVATCPRKTYEIEDFAFLERVDASRDLAVAVALELGPQVAQLRGVELGRHLLVMFREVAAEFDDESPDEGPADAEWPFLAGLERAAAAMRSHAATVYAAFRTVCRNELGLEPETVLRAHLGDFHVAQLRLDELEGAKPHKARQCEWSDKLRRHWRERIEDGSAGHLG